MNISRSWKWIVGTVATIGTLVTGIKNLREMFSSGFWDNLNPWHFTFVLFLLMLIGLGVVWCMEKLDARFATVREDIHLEFKKEINSLAALLEKEFDSRIKLAGELRGELKKESDSRIGGWETDRGRISDLEQRIAKLEKRS